MAKIKQKTGDYPLSHKRQNRHQTTKHLVRRKTRHPRR